MSVIFNDTMIHLYCCFKKTLEWNKWRLTFANLLEYSLAIHNLGGGHYFWGFINRTLNPSCRPVLDQRQFYLGHKRKHSYKYQSIVTLDGLVSSLIGLFTIRQGNWRMVELSGLEAKLCAVNQRRRPAMALYLYGDLVYATVYGIMEPYKNYPGRPRTPAHNRFNKWMSKLPIKVEHGFAIHQNL